MKAKPQFEWLVHAWAKLCNRSSFSLWLSEDFHQNIKRHNTSRWVAKAISQTLAVVMDVCRKQNALNKTSYLEPNRGHLENDIFFVNNIQNCNVHKGLSSQTQEEIAVVECFLSANTRKTDKKRVHCCWCSVCVRITFWYIPFFKQSLRDAKLQHSTNLLVKALLRLK